VKEIRPGSDDPGRGTSLLPPSFADGDGGMPYYYIAKPDTMTGAIQIGSI
jgi:hypothetical protein